MYGSIADMVGEHRPAGRTESRADAAADRPGGPGVIVGAVRTAVLTISTSVARRQNEDAAGPLLARLAEEAGADVEAMEVIPDDFPLIEDRLHHYVDDNFTFVFTTGGTGLTPDDVTPEATKAVIEREAPGIAEAMRAESMRHTPMGMLARGMAGVAHRTLIVNFPGNPKAIAELFPVIAPTLTHAAETLVRKGGRDGRSGGH
jgi:molybdenum cofactor synthesis domain-containing protein